MIEEKNRTEATPQETAAQTEQEKNTKIPCDGKDKNCTAGEAELSKGETPQENLAESAQGKEAPSDEEEIQSLQNQLINSQSKIEKIAKELDETKNIFRRTVAEYENYRKRTAKEKAEIYENGMVNAVESLLPIIDTLEIALAAPTKDENFKKGVEMTLTAAKNAFEKLGVEEIDAIDKPFDPNIHAAVSQREVEGVQRGIVVDQFQKGYRTKTKIIRHASVIVSC